MKEDSIIIYAIIPSYIYKTKELTSEEKLIAERITALCKKEGYSWISNKALADMYGIREDTVSKHIKKLKTIGFIKCLYNKDHKNKSKRAIYLTNNIWDIKPIKDSSNKQQEVGQISRHNNKYKYKSNNKDNITNQKFYVDDDNVMVWNGKRCEKKEPSLIEHQELEKWMAEFKDEANE